MCRSFRLPRTWLLSLAGVLAAASAGRAQVFVSSFTTNFVYKFDDQTSATLPPLSVTGQGNPAFFAGATARDGVLYLSSQGTDQILRVDPTTGISTAFLNLNSTTVPDFVPTMTEPNYGPAGLRFAANGDLFVSRFINQNSSRGAVDKFTLNLGTGNYEYSATVASGLRAPASLTFDGLGNLYISEQGAGQVLKYDGTNPATPFISFSNFTGTPTDSRLLSPTGLAFGPGNDLYVVDIGGTAVREYNGLTGAYVRDLVADTTPPSQTVAGGGGQQVFPSDLLFDNNGKLWVTNLVQGTDFSVPNGSVVQFDALTGAYLSTLSTNLFGPSQFALIPTPEPASVLAVCGLAAGAVQVVRRRRKAVTT